MKLPQPYHDHSTPGPDGQFLSFLDSHGFPAPAHLFLDGTLHRYGDKPGDDYLWYIAWSDGQPAGQVGNWRTGEVHQWKGQTSEPWGPLQQMAFNKRMVEAAAAREAEKAKKQAYAAESVQWIWDNAMAASEDHPYLKRKEVDPHLSRVTGDGRLVVPLFNAEGDLVSLQYISADGDKRFHLGGQTKAAFCTIGAPGPKAYLCEGFATGATIRETTLAQVFVAYSAHNLPAVAEIIRRQYPQVDLYIVADNDRSGTGLNYATQASALAGGRVIMPPTEGMDVNDYRKAGGDLLSLLEPKGRFDLIWGDRLPEEYEAPDEIIQGLITSKSMAILYGDSNSGKTFFAVAMAAALSEGADFFGKKVDQGKVLYLATESPGSIRSRMQAIKKSYGLGLSNFAMIPNPINLYSDPGVTHELIKTVRDIGGVKLIVADTLARMSAGANENSGEDMGPVMEQFSRLAEETGACVLVIHHSGKDAAKGSRGWSGIRAHIETEIEVKEENGVRTAEITKQRELSTKGEIIHFDLKVVEMGTSKFGEIASTCVAILAQEPEKKAAQTKGRDGLKLLKDAWFGSGFELENGVPKLSKAALQRHFEEALGLSPGTAKQRAAPYDGRYIKPLIDAGTLRHEAGFYYFLDDGLVSEMLVLRGS